MKKNFDIAQKYVRNFIKSVINSSLKLHYYQILLIITIIANLILYEISKYEEKIVINNFFTRQAEYILNVISKDIENILNSKSPRYVAVLKNYQLLNNDEAYDNSFIETIYGKNNERIAVDFISLLSFIEELGNNNFDYCLSLNNKILSCSNPEKTYALSLNKSVSNLILDLKILPKQSSFLEESNRRLCERAVVRAAISIVILGVLIITYLMKSKAIDLVQKTEKNIKTVIDYYNREKSFITGCYDYSKEDSELLERLSDVGLVEDDKNYDYLPLFLTQPTNDNIVNYFNIDRLGFSALVAGYNLIHNSTISLLIVNSTKSNSIKTFLCDELFIQLTESIMRNILQLKRNCSNGQIKVTYSDDEIIWECDLAKITKEFLIKWSKSTFAITGNPFLLNFKQIFQICEMFNVNIKINHDDTNLIIKTTFKADELEHDAKIPKSNIINFKAKNSIK